MLSFDQMKFRCPGILEDQTKALAENSDIIKWLGDHINNYMEIARFLWYIDPLRKEQHKIITLAGYCGSVNENECCTIKVDTLGDDWESLDTDLKDRYVILARFIQALVIPAARKEVKRYE